MPVNRPIQQVDTKCSSVDTGGLSQNTCLAVLDSVSTLPEVVYPRQVKSLELSGKRQGERESGICIQRSRGVPPRGEEEEEEGEEEEELKIEEVLVLKEIQSRTNISCKGSVDTPPTGVDTMLQSKGKMYPTQVKSLELSGKRQGERESGICIQRSRGAPPRGEEGEEEEELKIEGVLVLKEIQPSL
ncbi:hypothetical protein Taro_053793 [Colocasia esculenta]|uniref:Uncharacterized protein n=1 Tax=Colocasia esculenta TaxID=4460 RepID=A0A843XP60_COLES|nr:hypothetical protein [Colocasia esculenta]